METTIGNYGRMIFEMMCVKNGLPDHWESIKTKAQPLVQELIRLNSEMKPVGYDIIGTYDENGRKKLSKSKRIEIAQEMMWQVEATTLKTKDLVWINSGDYEMYIGQQDPGIVEDVTKKCIYVSTDYFGNSQLTKLFKGDKVLKAPDD